MSTQVKQRNVYWRSQFGLFVASGLWGRIAVLFHLIKQVLARVIFIAGVALSGPVVLALVVLRPIVVIRFGNLSADRIGMFTLQCSKYLIMRGLENYPVKRFDVVGAPGSIANTQFLIMFRRLKAIFPVAWLWALMDTACQFWSRSKMHHLDLGWNHQFYRRIAQGKCYLKFNATEICQGLEMLSRLGVPPGSKWVCIHNRDSKYLSDTMLGDWSYHSYRDFGVMDMLDAAQSFAAAGYIAFRMGSKQAEPLHQADPMIIDYAFSSYQSEFLDVFLSAGCEAYFGSDSGIATVPFVFGKPVSFINHSLTLLRQIINLSTRLVLPSITKHLVDTKSGRPIGLRGMFAAGLNCAASSKDFADAGITVVSNTPQEIGVLADEVIQRLGGSWKVNPQDEELQARFWRLFCDCEGKTDVSAIEARIGASFLRQHQYLVE